MGERIEYASGGMAGFSRPRLSKLAVLACVLGLACMPASGILARWTLEDSSMTMKTVVLIYVEILGSILASGVIEGLALYRIRRAKGTLRGRMLAMVGIGGTCTWTLVYGFCMLTM